MKYFTPWVRTKLLIMRLNYYQIENIETKLLQINLETKLLNSKFMEKKMIFKLITYLDIYIYIYILNFPLILV